MLLTDPIEGEKQKYLIYFIPSHEVLDSIKNFAGIKIPGSGLHCTICVFTMSPKKEEALLLQLSNTQFSPFEITTQNIDKFDNNSIVLRFSRPEELLNLHNSVLAVVEEYADQEFQKIANEYYGKNYCPHLTFSDNIAGINNKQVFAEIESTISEIYLSSKVNDQWEVIKVFEAQNESV